MATGENVAANKRCLALHVHPYFGKYQIGEVHARS